MCIFAVPYGSRKELNIAMPEIDNKEQNVTLRRTVDRLTSEDCLTYICPPEFTQSPIPSQGNVERIITLCREIIFPGYYGDRPLNSDNMSYWVGLNVEHLQRLLENEITSALMMAGEDGCNVSRTARRKGQELAEEFIGGLPELRSALKEDVEAVYGGDPAAKSTGEIVLCYPGIRAVLNHRVAHKLYRIGVPVLPRMISERAHRETGIDIHPGASIGRAFMIDHGTGVVIGETSVIGDRVKIYQGVTLGARSFPTDENNNAVKGLPRHPIIGNDVVVYSNTTILGRVTIGDNSTIGGNLWLTESLPADSIVLQANAEKTIRTKVEPKKS